MASKRSVTPYFMVSGMALALVILAVLQYRWTKQVSEGERERLRSSLQVSVQQFRQEFTRDLMSLTTGFQVQYGSGEDHDWSRYARQGSEWLRNAPDARLVSAVYLWDFSANDKGQLYRLNREEQIFSTLETPSSLQPLLARLREHAEGGWRGRGFRAFSWNLDTDHPALFRNLSSPPPPDFRDRKMTEAPRSSGFIVIELDRAYLQRHFLPELASRYFATSEGFLYHVGVFANGDHNRPIFQTSEFTASSFSSADVNIGLLETRGRNGGGGGPGPGMEGPGGPFPPEGGEARPPESRREDRPPQEARAGGFGRGRSFRGNMPPSSLLFRDGGTSWNLVVQHPAGSLQAAVKTMRWRNFAFSFGILILLGGSMALLVVSTQRAQRLARLQVEFVAGVSHELRTPLTVISSAAQNLKDGIVESTPQVKLYGKLIRDESQRLKGMVEHILDFAAGQQKKPYEPVPLQPTELISEALSMAASLITEFGIEVEQNVSPNLPVVMGERNGLTQSLHNLIVNAIKYRGDHPWLGIRAWTDQKWIRIAVEDRGLGIESTDLPYLFDAFFRGRAVTAAQIHGTGLGLNLAQTFAQAAGGKITVESTPGKGSCFTLHLPAASEADVEVPNLARQIA